MTRISPITIRNRMHYVKGSAITFRASRIARYNRAIDLNAPSIVARYMESNLNVENKRRGYMVNQYRTEIAGLEY